VLDWRVWAQRLPPKIIKLLFVSRFLKQKFIHKFFSNHAYIQRNRHINWVTFITALVVATSKTSQVFTWYVTLAGHRNDHIRTQCNHQIMQVTRQYLSITGNCNSMTNLHQPAITNDAQTAQQSTNSVISIQLLVGFWIHVQLTQA